MCTAFVKQGKDLIYGFNMDINYGAFEWKVFTEPDAFYVGLKPALSDSDMLALTSGEAPAEYGPDANGYIKILGVNRLGNFGSQLNNLNFKKAPFRLGPDSMPLYVLISQYISGKIGLPDILKTAAEKELVNLPGGSVEIPDLAMHSLLADRRGNIAVVEPGNGFAVIRERYAVLSNFSLLELPADFTEERSTYYGKDRYDTALRMLRASDDDFSVEDGLRILDAVKQTGTFGTRVSFVYSNNENAVWYTLEGDFSNIRKHKFS